MQPPRKNRPFHLARVASCAALLIAATPIAAQQVTSAAVPADASAAVRVISWPIAGQPTADARAPSNASGHLPGPRVRPQVRGVEARIAERRVSALPVAPPPNNTIVISTLALVLIAVIVTILVVK